MDTPEATENAMPETSQQRSLPIENNYQSVGNTILNNDCTEPPKIVDQINNSENQILVKPTDASSQSTNVTTELSSVVSTDKSMPPLPPLPKNDNEQLPQPPTAPLPADYNMQNYANYNNYMYNYNNYYGYPYPQYQWDYNSQQYYQPYQNYNYYNFNQANQTQTSKPPPPPLGAVQLPVEEKPANKTNVAVDDSNRYSPTAETDDDGLPENIKSDILTEQPSQTINAALYQTAPPEKIEEQQKIPENIDNVNHQTIDPSITPVQQSVPVVAQVQPYNIQVQQPSYPINPQNQMQSIETVNEVINQKQNSPALNGKDDSIEKVSKASTVLGKSQAKKRLMAFSMMKQKLQEQNNSITDNQSSDIGEGNDAEFVPEHNVFQTVTKKKVVVTNKKVAKVIKAQQTIEQIEEMKKDELLQGNNAALYQHLLRSGGNEAPILQKLGIESLAEKYSAKIREQDRVLERSSRHHHRRRDESRRSHKHRRRSHSKSRTRSRSTEKPKMRALEVKSWKDFVKGGFHFDRFRRFKMDEAEEIKEKERKSRKKKMHGDSRSDSKNHKNDSNIPSETEKGTGDKKLRHNILDRKKEILKGLEVNTHEADFTKDFPSYLIRCTKSKPVIKFSENPAYATYHLQNRQQMFATLLPEIEAIVVKFLSSIKPKKLKKNHIENNYNNIDEQLLVMMKDKNIYPFKGWWPIKNFIVTQVQEDPNVEIEENVLMNEITISKRTKKSRFNDDTSHVDLRPTVPSKWDSDYDGSPAAENNVAYVGATQSIEMNTNDNVCIIKKKESSPMDISHQEEAMDTASEVGEGDEPKIEVNVCPVLPIKIQEPQEHAKLNTEYEEFLKIVKAEKEESNNSITTTTNNVTILKENETNLSLTKSVSLNDGSVQDESEEYMSSKSSDESVSLHNAAEESDSNDGSYDEHLSSTIDLKNRKNKKSSSKKSKTFKNKESKKKRHKSSSSESSQDSASESDSSSDESDSESTDSSSTVEKKRKNKSKNKKKKKVKTNNKKKYKLDKYKSRSPEDEKDANSSILNLIEKALNVEIKKRPSDSKELKQKKKKKKHDKKDNKLIEENDDKFEKVKDCLKETITKLVKTDKVNKNQSLSCDETAVIEVLKYINDHKKKNKKSKKSSKRKHDSDISDDEKILKKSKLVDSCSKSKTNDKKKMSKKKKSVDSDDEHLTKKKSKKKSKTTDTSETEDIEGLNQNKCKNNSVQFFDLRPNEWNISKKSSMRGVIHQSEVKNVNKISLLNDTERCDKNLKKEKNSNNLIDNCHPINRNTNESEIPKLPNVFKDHVGEKEKRKTRLQKTNKHINSDRIDSISKNKTENCLINFKNSDSESNERENDELIFKKSVDKYNDTFELTKELKQTEFLKKDNNEHHNTDKDPKCIFKPETQSTPLDIYNKSPITCTVKPATEAISYRDKVKMNLKKLSTCQNISFVFGFPTPINLIKSNIFKLDKTKDFKVTNEENQSKEDEPKVNNSIVTETKLLNSDEPKVMPQTQIKESQVTITANQSPKVNIETDKKSIDHNDWDDSEDSDTDQSPTTSTDTSEHSSNNEKSDQIHSNTLVNDSPIRCNKSETFSNDTKFEEIEELTSNGFETNRLDSRSEEQKLPLEVDNVHIDKEITSLSNFADFSEQHSDNNTVGLQNNTILVETGKKDLFNIDIQEVSQSNNELIIQWTSDWVNFDKSVTEINHSSSSKSEDKNLQLKKKSRWDKESMDNKISRSPILNSELKKDKDEAKENILTDDLKYTCSSSNNEDNNEENQICEIMSIGCTNDNREFDPYVYDDYSQTYEQYSDIPVYSAMKTIEHNILSPIDYSVYENYNPNYNYHNEDYDMWKSIDTIASEHGMISSIPTTDESISQCEKHFEVLSSNNVAVEQVEFSKEEVSNENIDTISDIQDNQDKIVKNKKMDHANNDELFVKLYHQHFQHYNQNPIKYSLSNPVISNTDEVIVNIPDTLITPEKLSETDNNSDDIIAIPLRTRAYVCILEDDNTNLYLTSDNYMAYCAVEDKCMVHISVNPSSRDGVEDDVRHCFNINLSGTIYEYWLHADLIPFNVPSDAESGVFSDDEMDSLESDSGHEEDVNNENNNDIIESEWEIVDNINDDVNSWLDEPFILKKYTMENVNINEEHCVTSSSECDSDGSELSDSYVEMSNDKQHINENNSQKSLEIKDDKHQYQNVIDKVMPIDVSDKTENFATNSDLFVETESSEQLVTDDETKEKIDTLEVVNENNLTSKINVENNSDISMKLEKKENNGNKSGVVMKEEVTVDDLSMMDTIINQKILIQKLKVRAKEKIREKLPDTIMVGYSDNMETIKHPFLGLFQPPTNSILSKSRPIKSSHNSSSSKHVIFADGIRPGDNLAASPTHDDVGCPLSPPPLKALMRETLKFKRNMYPFKKSKVRAKLKMEKKKIAKVTPSIKATNSSVIEYYISRKRFANLPIEETPINTSNSSSNNDSDTIEKMSTPPRPTRDLTPVPSDNECWSDDDVIKNNK